MQSEPWNRLSAERGIASAGLVGLNAELARYWFGLWTDDSPPSRAAFNPAHVCGLLPGLALFELHIGGVIKCRLAGSAIDLRLGLKATDVDVLALVPPRHRQIRLARAESTVRGALGVGTRRVDRAIGHEELVQNVQLPFFGRLPNGAYQFLVHTNWRPDTDVLSLCPTARLTPGAAETFVCIPFWSSQSQRA